MPRKTYSYCEQHRLHFNSATALDRHILDKHTKLECQLCKRQFNNNEVFRLHMKVHERSGNNA